LLATVLLSQGTPMLAGGDELGHSQRGNNNPYCQDNPITWIDWPRADLPLLRFTARLLALRRQWLPLRPSWYTGLADGRGQHDLSWLRRGGGPLQDWDWNQSSSRVLGALIGAPGRGDRVLLMLFNAEPEDTTFSLPPGDWQPLLDTADDTIGLRDDQPPLHTSCPLAARSLVLLAGAALAPPPNRPRHGA
jgi:glycogen operon protein